MITKADYDELVRLREYGAVLVRMNGETVDIAAAIAEYERAQEGKE